MTFISNLDDINIKKKSTAIVFFPSFVLFLFGIAIWSFRSSVVYDQKMVAHSESVMRESEELINLITTVQIGILAHALSGKEELYTEATTNLTALHVKLGLLNDLTTDNSEQRKTLDDMTTVLEQFEKKVYIIGEAIKQGQRDVVLSALAELPLYQKSKLVREYFEQFVTAEHRLSEQRNKKLLNSTNRLLLGVLLGILFSSISSIFLGRLFSKNMTDRISSVISNFNSILRGEQLIPVSSGRDEIGQLDRALHQMADNLAARDEELDLFIYSVSHDLRSPLLNLQGFAQEIKINCDEIKSDLSSCTGPGLLKIEQTIDREVNQSVKYLQSAVQRLTTIIDALIHLSRVGRLSFDPTPIKMDDLVGKIVDALQSSVKEKKAEIVMGPLPAVWGDAPSIERAIGNLILNALNYLSPERPGLIEIGEVKDQKLVGNLNAVIYIRDNGLGFPDSSKDRIFLPFQRFHKENSKGEGIGLALVKRIVARNSGKIWLESQIGVGSTFYVSFPTSNPEQMMELLGGPLGTAVNYT